PGSMSLVSTNYSISENQGFLFVKAMRSNGSLGAIESTFNLPPRAGSNTIGVAQSATDYVFNLVNPRFATSWRAFAPDGSRELADGIIGTNNISTDPTGDSIQSPLDDIIVTIPNIPGYQGDRRALFQLDNPSYSDIFYL